MVDKNTFATMLNNMGSDYNQFEFLKNQYELVSPSLTANDIITLILPKLSSARYKHETITFFQPWFTSFKDLSLAVDDVDTAHYKMEFIKTLSKNVNDSEGMSKEQVLQLAKKFDTAHYKMELIKYFENWFTSEDIVLVMKIFDTDHSKMEIIKLLQSKKGKKSLTIDDVYVFMEHMLEDGGRIEIVKFYQNSIIGPNIYSMLLIMKNDSYKMELIKMFSNKLRETDAFSLIDYIDSNNNNLKLKLLKFIVEEIKPTVLTSAECLELFGTDEAMLMAMKLLDLKSLYNEVYKLWKPLKQLTTDEARFLALRLKFNSSPKDEITLKLVKCIEFFSNDKYKEKVFKMYLNEYKDKFDQTLFVDILDIFGKIKISNSNLTLPGGNKEFNLNILDRYLKVTKIEEPKMVNIIKKIEGDTINDNVYKLLKKHNYNVDNIVNIGKFILDVLDKETTDGLIDKESSESSDYSSESELELESEDDNFKIDEKGIVEIDVDSLDVSPQIAPYLSMFLKNPTIKFDTFTGQIVKDNSGFSDMSISINGVDVAQSINGEIKRKVAQMQKQNEENKKKKQQLKVPHAWKDEKVKDNDVVKDDDLCKICMERKRKIVLSCGHYHTCAKCTRSVLKGNKQCPVCRKEITNVTCVYA